MSFPMNLSRAQAAAKETDEEAVLIGEVWKTLPIKSAMGSYASIFGEELDSVTNYPLRSIWLDFLGKAGASLTHRRIMSCWKIIPRSIFMPP